MLFSLFLFSVFLQLSFCHSEDLTHDIAFSNSANHQEWRVTSAKQEETSKVDKKISWKFNTSLNVIPDYLPLEDYRASAEITRFMVLITIETEDSIYTCTGSILDDRRVLTAAHCFYSKEDSIDISEAYLVPSTLRGKGRSGVNLIQQVFVHRDFNATTLRNDIAIVTTLSPFTDDEARFVDIPESIKIKEIDQIYVASYGIHEITRERILMQMNYSLKGFTSCRSRFSQRIKDTINEEEVLCATERQFVVDGERACYGDSGSPLFYIEKEGNATKMVQVGIESFTETTCNLPDSTSWFTRISSYFNSIQQNQIENCPDWETIYRIAALCPDEDLESSG